MGIGLGCDPKQFQNDIDSVLFSSINPPFRGYHSYRLHGNLGATVGCANLRFKAVVDWIARDARQDGPRGSDCSAISCYSLHRIIHRVSVLPFSLHTVFPSGFSCLRGGSEDILATKNPKILSTRKHCHRTHGAFVVFPNGTKMSAQVVRRTGGHDAMLDVTHPAP